jgi:synaptotagmin-15
LEIISVFVFLGHKSLGRILLGGFMFARGKELEHWQKMMQTEKEHLQQWHTLSQI